jgi:hypothetical protein
MVTAGNSYVIWKEVCVCVRACVVEGGEKDWSSTLGASQIFFSP